MNDQKTETASLIQALHFSDADLIANREGRLSDAQQQLLHKRKTRAMLIGIGTFLGFAFIATLFLFFGSKPEGSAILIFIGIGLTICNALMVGLFFRQWLKLNADLQANRAVILTGQLERILKPLNKRVMNYMIRIANTETYVSKEIFQAFIHQASYTVYRTPYTGTLLSAERGDE